MGHAGHRQHSLTARDDTVYAFTREVTDTLTLAEIASTPTTAVTTVESKPLTSKDTPSGLVIDSPSAVVALKHVVARAAGY